MIILLAIKLLLITTVIMTVQYSNVPMNMYIYMYTCTYVVMCMSNMYIRDMEIM